MPAIGVTRTGTVRVWNYTGNYGFIAANSDGPDIYFHGRATVDRAWLPVIGQHVRFQLIREHDGRLRATRVVRVFDD